MRTGGLRMRTRAQCASLLLLAASLLFTPTPTAAQWTALDVPDSPEDQAALADAGRQIYETHCWYCHGDEGDGQGPVAPYLWPRPRDFQLVSFELRTTPSGALPTDEDLFRTVTLGAPGSAMPAWGPVLTPAERWEVISYIKTEFGFGIFEDEFFDPYQVVLDIGEPPSGSTEELVEAGRAVFEASDCWECHGAAGRGDGRGMDEISDDLGFPIWASDLESPWKFRGGSDPTDIYLRLTTGMDGTPMPSYAETLSEEERWQVAYYAASLAADIAPDGAGPVVIPATRTRGAVPGSPADEAWSAATVINIPLTGQATYPPRWQVPAVTDLSVRAVYNDEEIALRIEWNDRIVDSVPGDAALAAAEGWTAADSYVALFPDGARARGYHRDELDVVYPSGALTPPLPHFVFGEPGRPVDLWRWSAAGADDRAGRPVEELRGAGVEREPEALSGERAAATSEAVWVDGRWTVVLRRTLDEDVPFGPGALVPIAFHVRDGSHGETGLRMSLSSWYFLHLREPVRPAHLLLVLGAVLVAAAAELALVRVMRGRAAEGKLRVYGV